MDRPSVNAEELAVLDREDSDDALSPMNGMRF